MGDLTTFAVFAGGGYLGGTMLGYRTGCVKASEVLTLDPGSRRRIELAWWEYKTKELREDMEDWKRRFPDDALPSEEGTAGPFGTE